MTKQEMARFRRRRLKIVRLAKQGIPQAEIAKRFKMKRQRVNQIINNAQWAIGKLQIARGSMTPPERTAEWLRYYRAQMSPESRLGALRGALRDNVLSSVLRGLKVVTPENLVKALFREEIET